jgi:hypothetical protein
MSAYRCKLEGVARLLLPAPVPDFSGWTEEQVLLWSARNGGFEAVVEAANESYRPQMVTPEQHEAELRAAGKWREETPAEPEPEPATVDAESKREPGMPPNEPQWWEEKARFRHRGPEDYDWNGDKQAGYFCEVDYDPLADASVPSKCGRG